MNEPAEASYEVATILPQSILRYVARSVGEAAAEEIRVAAGEARTLGQMAERGKWSSMASTMAIAQAASRVTGDANIGRRGGEEMFRSYIEMGLAEMLRAEGTPTAALELIVESSSRVSVARLMTIVERSEHAILVEGSYQTGPPTSEVLCEFAAGFWSKVPSVFGATGYAAELECQARGDRRCLTRVAWTPLDPDVVDVAAAIDQRERVFVRFEELQTMASELVAATDVATVLDLIVKRAGSAVLAPRFLLVVRLDDDAELRVHHRGFTDDAAARVAAEALIEGAPMPSALVVDVASARRTYGKIAALYPPGSSDTGTYNPRLITAYAAHAAAALEAASAWERAERDRGTARVLLELGRSLARLGTPAEVCDRLAGAMPTLTGANAASVWLWEPESQQLNRAAAHPTDCAAALPQILTVVDVPGLDALAQVPRPVLLDVEDGSGAVRAAMVAEGSEFAAIVPLVARGTFLGMVSAGFRERLPDGARPLLLERLGGFADQAATAIDNAHLVERIRHQALHDALTGLPNRPVIEELTTRALSVAEHTDRKVGILFLDLDRFKNVNDTLGHRAGDDLIRQVVVRLRAATRSCDTLARVGGDEFVVLVTDVTDEPTVAHIADRLIESLRAPFELCGQQLFISCSIGIAVAPAHGVDYDELMQHADSAMYAAKDMGRDTFAVHVGGLPNVRQEMLELESALHSAIERSQLAVLYQPQVDLHTMDIVGVEALVRWNHPTRGTLSPDTFLSVAEDSGLIVAIDRWVRRTAFAQALAWEHDGLPPLRLALNLSTREIRNPSISRDLAADLTEFGIGPERVEIEVTDRIIMTEDDLPTVLASIRSTGVRLAIDDFGTGSSVLGRLQRCAVDTLKIDRSFVQEIASSSGEAIVAALVQMASALHLQAVAEGVETPAQASLLRDLGCPLAQGYFFSLPVPAPAITELLTGGVPRRLPGRARRAVRTWSDQPLLPANG